MIVQCSQVYLMSYTVCHRNSKFYYLLSPSFKSLTTVHFQHLNCSIKNSKETCGHAKTKIKMKWVLQ